MEHRSKHQIAAAVNPLKKIEQLIKGSWSNKVLRGCKTHVICIILTHNTARDLAQDYLIRDNI